ncbi:MAG: GNAT family N-acetyltransferase [Chloroflexi bacterium HGW-Chloroflexi-10]|nr:MAG: GNAT family N-acetyltransferase [Chloroflexi bacterium HGW-Chloroflexi-10]
MIRPETQNDYSTIYHINQLAFDEREAEARLVDTLRQTSAFIPELSLVAEEEGRIVGHILFSHIHIETPHGNIPAIALAPMAVLPDFQNRGIGSQLVREGLAACKHLGHAIVIVLGHTTYYPRFGFSAALAKALECPYGDCGDAWMAMELIPGALAGIQGKVVYPPEFDGV